MNTNFEHIFIPRKYVLSDKNLVNNTPVFISSNQPFFKVNEIEYINQFKLNIYNVN